jgi:hypothetical protein
MSNRLEFDRPAGFEPINLDDISEKDAENLADLFDLLRGYARSIATAKHLRRRGHVERAIASERIAARYYARLPLWARWLP